MRISGETLATRFDAFSDAINHPQALAIIFQIMRPPSETGRDFQNGFRRQTIANPRKNGARPLRGRTAPRLRPFLPGIFPIVFHLDEPKLWLGAESNRRHVE